VITCTSKIQISQSLRYQLLLSLPGADPPECSPFPRVFSIPAVVMKNRMVQRLAGCDRAGMR